MACIISGSGKVASSAACAWIAARYQDEASIAWINLGIAGAAQHDLGTLFSLHQIIDADNGHRYYPAPAIKGELEGSACMTLSKPSEDYREDCLFDMEASGFMYASLRFSSAELISPPLADSATATLALPSRSAAAAAPPRLDSLRSAALAESLLTILCDHTAPREQDAG